MAQKGRPGLSAKQKKDLWLRCKDGQSLTEIGRAIGKHPGSVHGVLSSNGGIVPRTRTRCAHSLTLEHRQEISRGLMAGDSMRQLARQLGRSPSTISREITRNGGRWAYRAASSEARAWGRTLRPKQCVLAGNSTLRRIVALKLQKDWSPQQIAGWLKCTYQNDSAMQLSHETIYCSLFIQARGGY